MTSPPREAIAATMLAPSLPSPTIETRGIIVAEYTFSIELAAALLRAAAGGLRSVRLLLVDAPSRIDLTMAPDGVLAIRHAALGAPRRRTHGRGGAHAHRWSQCQGLTCEARGAKMGGRVFARTSTA
jgi:hypothetical protein